MKAKFKILTITLLIVVVSLFTNDLNAQTDPPPPPPSGHGGSTNQPPGGGAPIGSGLFILIGLGAAYGAKKLHAKKKEK